MWAKSHLINEDVTFHSDVTYLSWIETRPKLADVATNANSPFAGRMVGTMWFHAETWLVEAVWSNLLECYFAELMWMKLFHESNWKLCWDLSMEATSSTNRNFISSFFFCCCSSRRPGDFPHCGRQFRCHDNVLPGSGELLPSSYAL